MKDPKDFKIEVPMAVKAVFISDQEIRGQTVRVGAQEYKKLRTQCERVNELLDKGLKMTINMPFYADDGSTKVFGKGFFIPMEEDSFEKIVKDLSNLCTVDEYQDTIALVDRAKALLGAKESEK